MLVAYETPTVKSNDAPDIDPAGFFEAYQSAIKTAMARHDIPYLDLSDFAPWTGGAMGDFIHPQFEVREMALKTVLAWILEPEALKESGILNGKTIPSVPEIAGRLK